MAKIFATFSDLILRLNILLPRREAWQNQYKMAAKA
jgi:hypothetical protein